MTPKEEQQIAHSEFGRVILAAKRLARRWLPKLNWDYDFGKSEYENLTALLNACAEAIPEKERSLAPAKKKKS